MKKYFYSAKKATENAYKSIKYSKDIDEAIKILQLVKKTNEMYDGAEVVHKNGMKYFFVPVGCDEFPSFSDNEVEEHEVN